MKSDTTDDDSSERQSPRCVDCGKVAPPTGTNYTLISSKFGWRLTRAAARDPGVKAMEWRCPACYARMRGQGST